MGLTLSFSLAGPRGLLGDDPPKTLGRDLHGALVRFATTGNPNGGALPYWPGYDLHRRATMLIDSSCTVIDDPRSVIRKLWERVEI